MPTFDFNGARQYALDRLDAQLSLLLYYHSAAHTRYDVLRATQRLAERSGVSGEDLQLLLTAVYFHDIGFTTLKAESLQDYVSLDHETAGIAIVKETLPAYGFTALQIERVAGIIAATRLPQKPQNLLEELIADADLDSLGRDDFWALSFALRAELEAFGMSFTDMEWYQRQFRFLSGHTYFTPAARQMRDEKKARNILSIHERIETIQRASNP